LGDRHYPGSTIIRTFALIDEHVVVIDRVQSDRPRTIDWCLRYAGGHQTDEDVAAGVDPPLTRRPESFTDKPSDRAHGVNYGRDLTSAGYSLATTSGMWRQANGQMIMAACPDTQVMVFGVSAAFSAAAKERKTGVPVLMVRRKDARCTDFIAAFSSQVRQVEQVPVKRSTGRPADAVGFKVRLESGRTFAGIANYEPQGVTVQLGELRTSKRFACDCPE
jgi:hypothetical protein